MAEAVAQAKGRAPQDSPNDAPEKAVAEKTESLWKDVWYSLRQNVPAMVSLVIIVLLAIVAIVTFVAPGILPYDPYQQDLSASFEPPSAAHWFGTDQQGRDIFCRILIGSQISLTVGLLSVAISLVIGVALGAIAGYKGGVVDTVIMRFMDMMLAIPSILLAIAFMAALGRGIDKAIIAIGFVSIPEYARIVRSQVLAVKQSDYVAAARVIGDSDSSSPTTWPRRASSATPTQRSSSATCSPTSCPPSSSAPRSASRAPFSTRPHWAFWALASSRPQRSGATCSDAAATTSLRRPTR